MSQLSVSDNEPLKPQELGSTVKVKKPSQKELFAEAAARKAGAAALAAFRAKREAEEAEAAERRREKEREKFMKEAEKAAKTKKILCGGGSGKTLEDFLPESADAAASGVYGVTIDRSEVGYQDAAAKASKDCHKYNAKINKKNKIDEENARILAAQGLTRLPKGRR